MLSDLHGLQFGTGNTGYYYIVELDNMLGETAFLRGWTSDMIHVNYGGVAGHLFRA